MVRKKRTKVPLEEDPISMEGGKRLQKKRRVTIAGLKEGKKKKKKSKKKKKQ